MLRLYKVLGFVSLAFCSYQAVSQPNNGQPVPTDAEEAYRQLMAAAECSLKLDHEKMSYLVNSNGGALEFFSTSEKPIMVLGLKSKKVITFVDSTGKLPDTYTSFIYASMNTVKQVANLHEPKTTEVGTLSVRYSKTPGTVEIVCTVSNNQS